MTNMPRDIDRLNNKCKAITGLTLSETGFGEINEYIVLDQYLSWIQENVYPPTASKPELLEIGRALNCALIRKTGSPQIHPF